MKFKDFQAPVLFSSTFKALNLGQKNSHTFKDAWEPCIYIRRCKRVASSVGEFATSGQQVHQTKSLSINNHAACNLSNSRLLPRAVM